ncbi:MAG: hypothetical protein IKH63_10105, partial [Prevotella sp.]|nr:hypothetical protein [Prevotella sp.]
LDDKAVCLSLPFLHGDGVHLILDAVDFLLLPSPQCQQAVASNWGRLSGSYTNPAWFNEGYDNQEGDVVGIRGNAGTIDSQAKGCGSGWGNIW